jgi:uncharacterized protein (TIGR03437 family)
MVIDQLPGSLHDADRPAQIQTTNNGLTNWAVTVEVNPSFAGILHAGIRATNGSVYVAAEHADGTLIGPAATIQDRYAGGTGETIMLFATGFGPALASGEALSVTPEIVIDGISADVAFAGQVGSGLGRFNVMVPPSYARPGRARGRAIKQF